MPDLSVVELGDPHLLEWNFANTGYARRMGFDFDGVLTKDGTELPLYLPRKFPVELIITARFEAERSRSEAWLVRHGVTCRRMIMFPGTPADRAKPQAMSRYKAEHYAASGLDFFTESDPIQAEEISDFTGKRVICPTIARVFR